MSCQPRPGSEGEGLGAFPVLWRCRPARARGSRHRRHADDIEIGCGGPLLGLTMGGFPLRVTWVVLSAAGTREREAVDSATAFPKDIEQAAVG